MYLLSYALFLFIGWCVYIKLITEKTVFIDINLTNCLSSFIDTISLSEWNVIFCGFVYLIFGLSLLGWEKLKKNDSFIKC